MLKSVWLKNVIKSSLNEAGSVLSCYYKCLSETVGAKECLMILCEPDGDEKTCFYINSKTTFYTSELNAETDKNIVQQVTNDRESVFSKEKLYAPLCFENVAVFGVLIFNGIGVSVISDEFAERLVAFSSCLYTESMGSIVKSYHNTVIKADKVCVDYKNGKIINRAVNSVSLEIYEKEFTVIMGASGCGKSSLINAIGAMLTPTEGKVLWHDKNVVKMTEKEKTAYRAKTVGFVFQRYNLISDLTVEENIKIASSLVKNPMEVKEVLELVGLSDKAKVYPYQLSGGEQQRVCIARALVKRAELLLCDEPTGALDTDNAKQIIEILKSISKEKGIPVVVITHNPNLVVLADHCIIMSNGCVVSDVLQPFALQAKDLKLK